MAGTEAGTFLLWRDLDEGQVAEIEGCAPSLRRALLAKHLRIPAGFAREPRRSSFVDFCHKNVSFALDAGMHGKKVSTLAGVMSDVLWWACGMIAGSVCIVGEETPANASTSQEHAAESIVDNGDTANGTDNTDPEKEKQQVSETAKDQDADQSATKTAEADHEDSEEDGAPKNGENSEGANGKAKEGETPAAESEPRQDSDSAARDTVETENEDAETETGARQDDMSAGKAALGAEEIKSLLPTYQSTFQRFDDQLLRHAVERPPYSIGVFSLNDVNAITGHAKSLFFDNFELYRVAFVPHKCVSTRPTPTVDEVRSARGDEATGTEDCAAPGEAGSKGPTEASGESTEPDGPKADKNAQFAKQLEEIRREFAVSMEQQRDAMEEKLKAVEEKMAAL